MVIAHKDMSESAIRAEAIAEERQMILDMVSGVLDPDGDDLDGLDAYDAVEFIANLIRVGFHRKQA